MLNKCLGGAAARYNEVRLRCRLPGTQAGDRREMTQKQIGNGGVVTHELPHGE